MAFSWVSKAGKNWTKTEKKFNLQFTGRQIPIEPTGDHLFPTVTIWDMTLEANFGHDSAKPFKHDIVNCPGLDLM
jgi:hypothetical protein